MATFTLPVGSITPYVGTQSSLIDLSNNGWLLCDGSQLEIKDYTDLYGAIGPAFGGDGTTTFNLPDLQGMFLRGVDGGTGRDPDAAARTGQSSTGNTGNSVGSVQQDAFAKHAHALGPDNNGYHACGEYSVYNIGTQTPNATGVSGGSTETRPKNVYVYYLIWSGGSSAVA